MRLFGMSLCLLLAISTAANAETQKPIKALLITGGCCHDYDKQKVILSEGISARANVEWTIVHEGGKSSTHKVSIHSDKNWADGYDVVVHNECFAKVTDLDFIHNITDAHKGGVPAVMIHCAMHNYRGKTDQWFRCVGVRSHNHGRHHPIKVEVIERKHPIMMGLPGGWQTPQGELYNIAELYDETTPLASGVSDNPSKSNVCVWVTQFGKARVFSTTLGHHNVTMETPPYLDMVAKGLLWACGKLDEDGKPMPGYEGTGVKPKKAGPQPTPANAP